MIQSRFKRLNEKDGPNKEMFKMKDPKFNLEKQMEAWRRNPVWDDNQPPGIEVRVVCYVW